MFWMEGSGKGKVRRKVKMGRWGRSRKPFALGEWVSAKEVPAVEMTSSTEFFLPPKSKVFKLSETYSSRSEPGV